MKDKAKAPVACVLHTEAGPIPYTLTRKRVRNINLRVKQGGEVAVSAPVRTATAEIERFLQSKAGWITAQRRRMRNSPVVEPCLYSEEQCMALFTELSEQYYPLFAEVLGHRRPRLRVRDMKTRWGSCSRKTGTITLNRRLAQRPRAAAEYVVLHEYVHFVHPNHQKGFHAMMARLMPDYKQRQKLLYADT